VTKYDLTPGTISAQNVIIADITPIFSALAEAPQLLDVHCFTSFNLLVFISFTFARSYSIHDFDKLLLISFVKTVTESLPAKIMNSWFFECFEVFYL